MTEQEGNPGEQKSSEPEFHAWAKVPRLYRDIVITEKIDGTNAAIGITEFSEVYAQSRTRIITPEADNFGFAKFVKDNEEMLVETLGPGLHFGEWWGSGIQRNYGYKKGERFFSLFNHAKYEENLSEFEGALRICPKVYEGPFSQTGIDYALNHLRAHGSLVAEGFMNPEGIVIQHIASRHMYKVTLEKDGEPKGKMANA